jgi:hypothetical protein
MLVLTKNNFKPIIYLILALPTLLQIVILPVHPANGRQVDKNQHLVAQVPGGIIDVLYFFKTNKSEVMIYEQRGRIFMNVFTGSGGVVKETAGQRVKDVNRYSVEAEGILYTALFPNKGRPQLQVYYKSKLVSSETAISFVNANN